MNVHDPDNISRDDDDVRVPVYVCAALLEAFARSSSSFFWRLK
jgi:hypothetical protein